MRGELCLVFGLVAVLVCGSVAGGEFWNDEGLTAVLMHSWRVLMKMGVLRAPGDFRILESWVRVCCRM